MGYFKDLREHIAALDEAGLLVKIDEQINKDTELMPLVRWQFRGLSEDERRAFMFTNVIGCEGTQSTTFPWWSGRWRLHDRSTALGCNVSPRRSSIVGTKRRAIRSRRRSSRMLPVHEEVHRGSSLMDKGGLGEFPIPISTPGYDCAPFTTASHWFTQDPETGLINIGNYRGHIKSPTRTGVFLSSSNHGGYHWRKCQERGIPLQAALVIGAPPSVSYTAPARIPFSVSELDVAGGLAGAPIEVVKCITNDVLVPANAEIVIEGEISTEFLEPEAPFGESTGYIAERLLNPYFEVKCITHRKNPIFRHHHQPDAAQRVERDAPGGGGRKLSPIPERPVQHPRHRRGGFSQHRRAPDLRHQDEKDQSGPCLASLAQHGGLQSRHG